MAVHRYMITPSYVRDWTLFDAIREFVSNAYDAEAEHHTVSSIRHEKDTLLIENPNVKLDIKSLYFGGTSKIGRADLIGTYGEGLKLALLVCARDRVPVKVVNDDETWTPSFEVDDNGVESFVITTRSVKPKGVVRVEIPGVDVDQWYLIQQLFLRLMPPVETILTSKGVILLDLEYQGRRYAKGVFIDKMNDASFGYNFYSLNVGRDRKSYRALEATQVIGEMWAEASADPDRAVQCYLAMARAAPEFSGLQYIESGDLPDRLLHVFRERHGEDAYPVDSASEGLLLEHSGVKPVNVSFVLNSMLRKRLPSVNEIIRKAQQAITREYSIEELTEDEKEVLRGILSLAEPLGIPVLPSIVSFHGAGMEGLMSEGRIYLSRKVLVSFGKALGVFIHEAEHLGGAGDGTIGHVDEIHARMEKAFDLLWEKANK